MLPFLYYPSYDGEHWIASGQLARSAWQGLRHRTPPGRVVIDFTDGAPTDRAGEDLLAEAGGAGLDLTVTRPEHRHIGACDVCGSPFNLVEAVTSKP